MEYTFLPIGFGNGVIKDRVLAILAPDSAAARRLKSEARADHRLVDASQGRKVRSVLVMDTNHIILSSMTVETLSHKFARVAHLEESDADLDAPE